MSSHTDAVATQPPAHVALGLGAGDQAVSWRTDRSPHLLISGRECFERSQILARVGASLELQGWQVFTDTSLTEPSLTRGRRASNPIAQIDPAELPPIESAFDTFLERKMRMEMRTRLNTPTPAAGRPDSVPVALIVDLRTPRPGDLIFGTPWTRQKRVLEHIARRGRTVNMHVILGTCAVGATSLSGRLRDCFEARLTFDDTPELDTYEFNDGCGTVHRGILAGPGDEQAEPMSTTGFRCRPGFPSSSF